MIKYKFTVNKKYYIVAYEKHGNWYYTLYTKRFLKDKKIKHIYCNIFEKSFHDIYSKLFNGEYYQYMVPNPFSNTHPFL